MSLSTLEFPVLVLSFIPLFKCVYYGKTYLVCITVTCILLRNEWNCYKYLMMSLYL